MRGAVLLLHLACFLPIFNLPLPVMVIHIRRARTPKADSCLASQEFPFLLQNLKVHYHVHNSATGPYPEPDEFCPRPHTLFL